MKTSVVHRTPGSRVGLAGVAYQRARLEADPPAEGVRVAKLWPAHVEKGTTVVSIEPFKTRPYSRRVPDAILGCPAKNGQSDCARLISPSYVDALDEYDRRIADLIRERAELIEEAYRHGRPLRKADL